MYCMCMLQWQIVWNDFWNCPEYFRSVGWLTNSPGNEYEFEITRQGSYVVIQNDAIWNLLLLLSVLKSELAAG